MDTLLQDLSYAARQFVRGRTSTVVAVLTLALGIGANTSMFTLLNVMLVKPAPAADPERLVWIAPTTGRGERFQNMSTPDYRAYRDHADVFSGVLGFSAIGVSLGGGVPERIRGLIVSGNYFDVLGVRAAAGRTFRPDEDGVPGAHPVAVLSDAFWKRRFGASRSVLDSTITINGHPFTVIGIGQPGFTGIEIDDDPPVVWVPMAMIAQAMPSNASLLDDADASWLRVIARLSPGATVATAGAAATVVVRQLHPPSARPGNERGVAVLPVAGALDPANRSELLPVLSLLMIVPALVLLVACANAANLLLARALARRKELAMRRALGATRARLVRQLLTESVLSALAAAGVGVLLSYWLTAIIVRVGEFPLEIAGRLTPDVRVLVATTALAIVTGLAFGLAPALAATRPSLVPALKDEGVTLALGRRRHRLRDALVVGQVAVSLVLLVTAGLFLRSLGKALRVDPGFDPHGAVAMSFDLELQGYPKAMRPALHDRLVAAALSLPGVESAALASVLPLSGRMYGNGLLPEGTAGGEREIGVHLSSVSPGYFSTMRVALRRGRDISARDHAAAAPVVIVNETLARRLWPGGDAIGQRVRFAERGEPLREVIGVVRDGKYDELTESPRAFIYLPERQYPSGAMTLVVRARGDPAALIAPLTAAVRAIDPDLPLYDVETLEHSVAGAGDKQRAASSMLGVFGALALLLAAIGMYGVTAHGVTLRTREVGIRMSLGAKAGDVLRMFVGEGLVRSLVGVGIGLVLSAAVSTVLAKFLFGLRGTDASTFVVGAGVLCTVAVLASWIPARRAARVNPIEALRCE